MVAHPLAWLVAPFVTLCVQKSGQKAAGTGAFARVISRWFALVAGTLSTVAATCIGNTVTGNASSVDGATQVTVHILAMFLVLNMFFFRNKKALDDAVKDEKKQGVLDMTPSELLSLTVDEAITNLSSAMASIVAGLWFGLLPATHTLMILCGGSAILMLGESLQLTSTKGSLGSFQLQSLNALNCGSVSWLVGFGMSNVTQLWCGASTPGELKYWMWGVALIIGGANMELVNYLSVHVCGTSDMKPYGSVFFKMLKGVPMFSSGLILNNIVQQRWANDYATGTAVWCGISAFAVVFIDQYVKTKSPHSSYVDDKVAYTLGNDVVSLLQQSFAFICGQLATSALAEYLPNASNAMWCALAAVFQVLAFVLETGRTTSLARLEKRLASAREIEVGYEQLVA